MIGRYGAALSAAGAVFICLIAAALTFAAPQLGTINGGRYGMAHTALPYGAPKSFVIYLSDGGWTAQDEAVIAALAKQGALAVGVDRNKYLERLPEPKTHCDQLLGDAEGIARKLQHSRPGAAYLFPILAGRSESGALVGAILQQATPRTIGGALTLDITDSVAQPRALCAGAKAEEISAGRYRYGPTPTLNGVWTAGVSGDAESPGTKRIDQLIAGGTPIDRVALDATLGVPDRFAALLARQAPAAAVVGVESLPLIELPAAAPSDKLVILLSGDGGWRDLDAVIAMRLQAEGVNVVGWDSLQYFWRRKTPQRTAQDLAKTISFYTDKYHATSVALVGYSFGANVLPPAYNLLPEPAKSKIKQISLLAIAQRGDWEIQVTGWFGADWGPDALPVKDELARVPGRLIQCIRGTEEKTSACPQLAGAGAELIDITGGHHFDHNYQGLAMRILNGFERRSAGEAK